MDSEKKILFIAVAVVFFVFLVLFLIFSGEEEAPIHLSAEPVSSSEIMLSWIGNEKATQYNIYRKKENEDQYVRIDFTSETEYVDKNLEMGTTYEYNVTQVIDFEESARSQKASATTSTGIPTGLKVEAGSFQEDLKLRINLIWDYSLGADGYVVYRSEDEEGIYERIATTVNENYSDTDLLPQTTYYYVVTQIAEGQEGDYSNEASATTGSVWHCGEDLKYGGENYRTLRIGEQCWFQKNLNITDGETDLNCELERHCYNNDGAMCGVYGGLYTFSGISCGQSGEGFQGICPLGWRVPTDKDWITLETELGMREEEIKKYGFRGTDEGSKLAGRYNLWRNGDLRQSRSFGVSRMDMLPGGHQPGFNIRLFYNIGESGIFWSSTRANDDEECTFWEAAYSIREINYNNTKVRRDCYQTTGTAYVRCVRDY